MLLRSSVERFLPLKKDEAYLSDDARWAVFQGEYGDPGTQIKSVETRQNYDRETEVHYPVVLRVTREADGRQTFSDNQRSRRVFRASPTHIVEEMRQPDKLNRANRVEKVARRMKAVAGLAVIATALGLLVDSGVEAHERSHARGGIAGCETVVDGKQPLKPVDHARAEQLQNAGGLVCELAGYEYEVGGE